MKYLFLVILMIFSSCTSRKNPLGNQTLEGHSELYSEPDEIDRLKDKSLKRIIIASTSDIHGHYESQKITFEDKHNSREQTIQVGGVDIVSSYFKILRQEYGPVLLVDSGDLFPEDSKKISYVQDYYSQLGYDALSLGLSDFQLKVSSPYKNQIDLFQKFTLHSKAPLLVSNLFDLKTSRNVEWPGTLPYLIRDVDGVKIGIIGLIPDDIVEDTPTDHRVGLYIENMLQSTLRNARLLRSLGADIIVVLTHQGINCGEKLSQELNLPLTKINFEPERSDLCDLSHPMGLYLKRLPPNLIDLVIGGRNHQKTANIINSTIVMNSFSDGKSFSYVEFFFDKKLNKLNKNKTIIHQPVYFCREFFKDTNDCYTEDQSVNHQNKIPARFLGEEITPDPSIQEKFVNLLKTE